LRRRELLAAWQRSRLRCPGSIASRRQLQFLLAEDRFVPDWPSPAEWDELCQRVGGRLIAVQSPLQPCREATAAGSPVAPASIATISASRSHSTGSRSVCAFMEGPAKPNPSPSPPVAVRK
jgi:hypothetical protein